MTNFRAIIGGHTVGSVLSDTGRFGWVLEDSKGPPWPYDFTAGVGSVFFSDGFASSNVSGNEFLISKDPLAFMLLNAPHLFGVPGVLNTTPGWNLAGSFKVTAFPVPVPTPGILALLFAALAGLAISRRRKQFVSHH